MLIIVQIETDKTVAGCLTDLPQIQPLPPAYIVDAFTANRVSAAQCNSGQYALFASIKSSRVDFATEALGTVFDSVIACHSF